MQVLVRFLMRTLIVKQKIEGATGLTSVSQVSHTREIALAPEHQS
ncbi:hypothetical protein Mal52_62190 [Symmachiella dynata]|uniref:Uncharacterized protein n=1 Tax=Symmachiella dynata TaxID=2527995 RepID=A0A517ZYW9_9PLAN|nr:hypothetical protein Mal52_62190 [Symmachiella dynata]